MVNSFTVMNGAVLPDIQTSFCSCFRCCTDLQILTVAWILAASQVIYRHCANCVSYLLSNCGQSDYVRCTAQYFGEIVAACFEILFCYLSGVTGNPGKSLVRTLAKNQRGNLPNKSYCHQWLSWHCFLQNIALSLTSLPADFEQTRQLNLFQFLVLAVPFYIWMRILREESLYLQQTWLQKMFRYVEFNQTLRQNLLHLKTLV